MGGGCARLPTCPKHKKTVLKANQMLRQVGNLTISKRTQDLSGLDLSHLSGGKGGGHRAEKWLFTPVDTRLALYLGSQKFITLVLLHCDSQ